MERGIFGRMRAFRIALAASALAACTGSGAPENDLPDSVAPALPGAPAPAAQPIQAESVTGAPARTPAGTQTTPARRTPNQAEPAKIQPPKEPYDIRPSIPWPPETLRTSGQPSP